MTEWLKLERLELNDLPLPKYESEASAGVDFAACLTRPCKRISQGGSHKDAESFLVGRNDSRILLNKIDQDKNWQTISQGFEEHRRSIYVNPGETIMIPLGFKSEFGRAYVLQIHVRSSAGLSGLFLANGTGIVDPDYRGELFACVYNRNLTVPIPISHGQRVVQGVLLQFRQAIITEETVDKTERGDGGFGSTGDIIKSEEPEPAPQPATEP